MADRDTLTLLEAIRLEIRAASYTSGSENRKRLQERANKLVVIAFSNIQLANDEREALGQ